MLKLIEDKSAIRAAQKALERRLTSEWVAREKRLIVWRPSSKELRIAHNDAFWFASYELDDAPTPRFWNSFGGYKKAGNLNITVEINIPTGANRRRIAGFFAADETGRIFLMHDGSLGGGREGVSREDFLFFLQAPLASVVAKDGSSREGVVVACITDAYASKAIARFVQSAMDFKIAVANGALNTPEAKKAKKTYGAYFREFSGLKKRQALAEIEYFTRHGDIVEALRKWRPLAAASTR